MRQGHAVNVARLIAGFLGGDVTEDDVRKDSQRHCRYILLSDLTCVDMERATRGARPREVFPRSRSALIGEIDAFVSHSWHDDPKEKWAALETWCNDFHAKHGRQPKLWLDFCCIDQKDIEANVRCLPVYLAGCHSLLVIAGPTYVRRLWCAVELFVFVGIQGSTYVEEDEISYCCPSASLELSVLGQTEEQRNIVYESLKNFDAVNCVCSQINDQERLQGIVEAGSGTVDRFNVQIRGMWAVFSKQPE
jgi:hypothetical protein